MKYGEATHNSATNPHRVILSDEIDRKLGRPFRLMDRSFALLEKVETALISGSLRHRLVVGNARNEALRLGRYLRFILGQTADFS
jgi:hypothetical protein